MKIFVSYSSLDREQVARLVDDLEVIGHEVWFDQELSGGQVWWDRIMANLRDCDLVIFALSPHWLNSYASGLEFDYATALGKNRLPVRISATVDLGLLPKDIQSLQIVSYDPAERESLRQLARALTLMPPPRALPDPLPPAPRAPISQTADIAERLSELSLALEEQRVILEKIEGMIESQADRRHALALLARLRAHPDASPEIVRAADALLKGPVSPVRRGLPVWAWALGGLALLIGLGALWFSLMRPADESPETAAVLPPTATTRPPTEIPTDAAPAPEVIASPSATPTAAASLPTDPGLIAFVGNGDLYVVSPDGSGLRNLTLDNDAVMGSTFYWLPDQSALVYSVAQVCHLFDDLYAPCDLPTGLIGREGGAPRLFAETPCQETWWLHSGENLIFICSDGPTDQIAYLTGLDAVPVHSFSMPWATYGTTENSYSGISRISPDNQWVAYECNFYSTGNQDLCVNAPDTAQVSAIAVSVNDESYPAWSPDSSLIAFIAQWDKERPDQTREGNGIYVISPDGTGLRQVLALTPDLYSSYLAWSADGQYLSFTRGDDDPYDVDQIEVAALDGSGNWIASPTGLEQGYTVSWQRYLWSPVGHSLLMEWAGDLYTYQPGDSGPRNISNSVTEEGCPAWSLDGRRIAFLRQEFGLYDLYVMNADGSGLIRITDTPQYSESCPQWAR